eukprot:7122973-Pyramimonas_sp.AAC.1
MAPLRANPHSVDASPRRRRLAPLKNCLVSQRTVGRIAYTSAQWITLCARALARAPARAARARNECPTQQQEREDSGRADCRKSQPSGLACSAESPCPPTH